MTTSELCKLHDRAFAAILEIAKDHGPQSNELTEAASLVAHIFEYPFADVLIEVGSYALRFKKEGEQLLDEGRRLRGDIPNATPGVNTSYTYEELSTESQELARQQFATISGIQASDAIRYAVGWKFYRNGRVSSYRKNLVSGC